MGQKVNPIGFRTGTFLPWQSRWFASNKEYKDYLLEDIKIRESLMDKLKLAGIVSVEIERLHNTMVVVLTVARPGVVIGRGGSGLEDVKKTILATVSKVRGVRVKDMKIDLRVQEVKNAELSAYLVATRIVSEMERRMPHRRVVMRALERVMQSGALGVKVILGGRIAGAEISRREKYHQGSIPTQTLRANIDYAEVPASLQRGYVGVKVYIHKKKDD